MATRRHGATTVASTMRLAALAGIRVFVTGGLGGVHRGAENSMDVSADLTELSQTDVAQLRFVLIGVGLMALLVFRPQGIFGDRREVMFDAR